MKWLILLGILLVLPQGEVLPPEGPVKRPSVNILWMVLPAPKADTVVTDLTLVSDKLIVVTDQDFSTQALANTFCNNIIINSNLVISNDPTNPARDRLAGCVIVHYTAVDSDTDYSWGKANTVNLGIQYGADLRQFITRSGNWCGLGVQDAWKYGVDWTYSWVSKGCVGGNFSEIHEEGHNRGANHDAPNSGGGLLSFAQGFCGTTLKDVMTYPSPCGNPRGPYFSNPNILVAGLPFGDPILADNARAIRETALAISNMRQSVSIQNHQR